MQLTRRAFLGSATGVLASGLSSVLPGCAGSPERGRHVSRSAAVAAGRGIFRPPKGSVVFIAGQGASQVGGLPAEGCGDGYLDHMPTPPGGFTLYCDVSAGTLHPTDVRLCGLPALRDSLLHLSVSWVADLDTDTMPNNRLITTGAFDGNIDRLAGWCAAQPRPILMRIGYEFDRGLPVRNFHYDPAYFAPAFRRIVDRVRSAGAGNVATVLASTNYPSLSPALTTESFNRFYPGDDYVDWLGCSMWHPADVDRVILAEARRRGKPVLLAETTPLKYNIGRRAHYPLYLGVVQRIGAREIWDRWHRPMIEFVRANGDVIAGWHYIAANWSADAVWGKVPLFTNCDARPWANEEFLEIWHRHMNAAPFLQASKSLFSDLGYRTQGQ